MTDGVFIALPVYRGVEVIAETLRSIKAQTLQDYHVVMSVDGADDSTIGICKEFTSDRRFDLVVQKERLGWPGNLNRLITMCDRPFFCYWQQDDLASTNYLETLRNELLTRPEAAIAYSDVQWFGASFERTHTPTIEGPALHRVVQHIEAIRYEPFRGVMRSAMLPARTDPIPVTIDESCQEEFVFLTEMAAAGPFVRSERAMYFKRLHNENAFMRWRDFPDWKRRRGWISMGAGMYRIATKLGDVTEGPRLLGTVIDRLSVERSGRAFFYLPPQTPIEFERFTRDFTSVVGETAPGSAEYGALERPVHPSILMGLDVQSQHAQIRAGLAERVAHDGTASLGPDALEPVLGYGWSVPESWGIWSDGEEATLRLGTHQDPIRVMVKARVYRMDAGSPRVGYAAGNGVLEYADGKPEAELELVIDSHPDSNGDHIIRFHLPDARSPASDGVLEDHRVLGIGLTRITMERD